MKHLTEEVTRAKKAMSTATCMVWYGMVWYGMVWYGTIPYRNQILSPLCFLELSKVDA